ncbi:unnamed protein product [Lepeophtheirus salmonis]|uniref:(salmon louse) hypothetical protein n=1 Tax=Lepeophtheirus salmonis TaxID=72036 RepID=A0A7R8D1E9_LEPSM|nr:unnamed protein product [Lepeophtheirus salmonis]CAF2992862.1 unnamed protein product [Lepeophtheirus salmonis]
MIQAWSLFKTVGKFNKNKREEQMCQIDFMRKCVSAMLTNHVVRSKNRTTPNTNSFMIHKRYDQRTTLSTSKVTQNVFAKCARRPNSDKGIVFYRCRRCNVGIHIQYFESYHTWQETQ